MAEEPKGTGTPDTASPSPDALAKALSGLAGAVKLDWVRPLIWRLGGRKTAVLAPLAAVVTKMTIETPGDLSLAKGIMVAGVWIGAGIMSMSIGMEDAGKVRE